MSTESHDAEAADQMRQQIRVIVREIETIARADIPPAEFYEGFLGRVVSAMAAEGGAVWTIGEGNRLELAYQINIRATGLAEDQKCKSNMAACCAKSSNKTKEPSPRPTRTIPIPTWATRPSF
ncbi:MAG: hypothetical protein QM811_17765 [Pirellulales bacterium]